MRLAVCEAPPRLAPDTPAWDDLATRVRHDAPDALLLNEMPFGEWIAAAPERDEAVLEASRREHHHGLSRLADLGAPSVLGTRAAREATRSVNEAFVWDRSAGARPMHTKQFFPDEPGFFEARWYERGSRRFGLADAGGLRVGFLICTDVMFLEWARFYGRQGAHLIAVPRATPAESLSRWKAVITAAAIVSGCYVASSNRAGRHDTGFAFGGHGWIVAPSGDLLAETSPDRPVASAVIDPGEAERARREYPCYVEDLPGSPATGRGAP